MRTIAAHLSMRRLLHGDVFAFLDRAFNYFFSAYVFVTIFLPSGTLYGINFKSPLYLGLLPLASYSLFRRQRARLCQLVLTLAVPVTLAAWAVLGIWNGFDLVSAQRQFSDILLTFLTCWLAFIFCQGEQARCLLLLRLVVGSVVATSALKIGLILYAVSHGMPVVEMVSLLDKAFGSDLMTMDLGSLFGRLQFISDELIPICIFIVLRHRNQLKLNEVFASLITIVLIASVIFSFSRYLWGFSALAFLLGIVLGKKDKFQATLGILITLSILASFPALSSVYNLRFSTEVAGSSDLARTEQIPALEGFFFEAPLLGHGLGSYTSRVVRGSTPAGRYAYEVEILAMSAQLGMLGMGLLALLALYYYRALWLQSNLAAGDRMGIGVLLLAWIAAGFSNPLLFHPVAGINYAALAALLGYGRKQLPSTAKAELHPNLMPREQFLSVSPHFSHSRD